MFGVSNTYSPGIWMSRETSLNEHLDMQTPEEVVKGASKLNPTQRTSFIPSLLHSVVYSFIHTRRPNRFQGATFDEAEDHEHGYAPRTFWLQWFRLDLWPLAFVGEAATSYSYGIRQSAEHGRRPSRGRSPSSSRSRERASVDTNRLWRLSGG